jgi:outer membrane protein insertion porin family
LRVFLPLVALAATAPIGAGAAWATPDSDASEELADGSPAAEPPAPEFQDPAFGPRYVIESIVVRGNRKTETSLIAGELAAVGLRAGVEVGASDGRVEAARFRLLSLGYFLDARLSVGRGAKRGGAVLLVEVEERGTIVINDLFLGTSAATAFWGGLDVSETNLVGRGINVGAGFVGSTRPITEGAVRGFGVRGHASVPELQGPGISLSITGLLSDGSELFRVSGSDSDPDPRKFTAVHTRRGGGILGAGKTLSRSLRLYADFREETVSATVPDRMRMLESGLLVPIDFGVRDGYSRVGSLTATAELDTRSDPVLPRTGYRLSASAEFATSWLASSYTFAKFLAQGSIYTGLRWGHVLGFHALGGAIIGDAPYFDQFFIGDLNLLLPRRALGLNFSTLPSRNVLGTGIAGHRYDDYAGRLLVEYAIPILRRHGFVYRGDFFVAFGALALGSSGDFEGRSVSWSTLPLDLTADVGLRLDTYVGVFTISIANALSRSSF